VDQISKLVHNLKHNPDSRRLLVVAYNLGVVDEMALPPCHSLFQFYVANGKLSCQLYQHSADLFLGVPFLGHMLAQQADLEVGEFVHTFGDCHLYHITDDIVHEQLSRTPRALLELLIKRKPESIFDYRFDDFEIVGYDPYPTIRAPIAV